jgi:hypothetical protein
MKFLFSFFIFCFLFIAHESLAQESVARLQNDLEGSGAQEPWINLQTVASGDAHSGSHFSSTHAQAPFGLGYRGRFPERGRDRNLHITIGSFLRTDQMGNEFFLVAAVSSGDSTVYWNSFNVSDRINRKNTWTPVREEINIPASFTGNNFTFSIYLWNKDGRSKVDIDDLTLDFEIMKLPSFLPEGKPTNRNFSGMLKQAASGPFTVFYSKDEGNLLVMGKENDTLINGLSMVSAWMTPQREIKQTWTRLLKYQGDSVTEEGIYFRFSLTNEISENTLELLAGNDGQLSFNVITVFVKPVELYRHTLVVDYSLPLAEVYKKNTLADTAGFREEYWLGGEGFRLASAHHSFVLYRPEKISSVQLDTRARAAYINLDYALDHPLLHYPLLKENKNIFEDRSESVYRTNDTITSLFTFRLTTPRLLLPRMMNTPRGFLSSFTWTEHADYGDMRLHKAVYFGSEKINDPDLSTGGFVKYSIPVTKSYFYANPDTVNNREKAGFLPGPLTSAKEDPAFLNFLKQLNENGYEICLHTPDPYSSNRALLEEALDQARREFAPVTWIDHGYDNSEKSNRENLVCDGTDSTSRWYAADLWKKYGIRYLWNTFYEDTSIFSGYGFNSFFSFPYSGWGDVFPVPGYWRNKTRTGDFIHWGTMSTWDPPDANYWQYFFNDLRLTDLVNNRCEVILHCYPARVDSSSGFYAFQGGLAVSDPHFDEALKKLSAYRSQSKIWLVTVRELLDYRLLLEQVSCNIQPDGSVVVKNNGRNRIGGLTFSAYGKEAIVKDKQPEYKIVNGELIFWFDLAPGESTVVTIR